MSDNVKNITVGLVAVALIIAAYFFFVGGNEPETAADLTAGSGIVGPSSAETVAMIQQLQDLDLQANFLASSAFDDLADFSLTLNEQPVGRDNPFAPILYTFPGPLFVEERDASIPSASSRSTSEFSTTSQSTSTSSPASGTSSDVTTESGTSSEDASDDVAEETDDASPSTSPFGDL